MSPGVPQDTSLLEFNSENQSSVLRAVRREGIDQKAVGGHLTLSKRNSTPVGAGQLGMGVVGVTRHTPTTCTNGNTNIEHRRLDRCHSEPAKNNSTSGGGGGGGGGQGGGGGGGNSSRYKTELCRPFEEHGFCKYGDKCQFAHGGPELRTLSRHPKYKTELCRTFHTIGFCPYGPRCHFIHNAEERRGAPPSGSTGTGPPSPSPSPGPHTSPLTMAMSLGSAADSPSPPSSLHGSPTSPSAFFDDAFTLFPGYGRHRGVGVGVLEGLTVGLNGYSNASPASPSPGGSLPGLDTPPISPVESLAGDLDSLSLSSSHSASPTPLTHVHGHTHAHVHAHAHAHALDISRSLRLPIFEQLCEHD